MQQPARRGRLGFTLVEMLVTIGIIAVLAGLALVAVHAARGKAEQARMASDLQTIAIALDAYKADFGDYPRIPEAPSAPVVYPVTPHKFPPIPDAMALGGILPNAQYISGGELLCWALVGPYEMGPTANYTSAMSGAAANPKFPIFGNPPSDIRPGDSAAGPGLRLNASGRGQVYASYLNVERFRIGRQEGYERYLSILDSQGKPILYFPMSPRRAGLTGGAPTVARNLIATYDFRDNEVAFWRSEMNPAMPLARMRVMLGDRNADGVIATDEKTPAALPYLLWSAGPDTLYGPTDPFNATEVTNCDDVTNVKY